MADGINTAMNAVQATGGNSIRNSARVDAGAFELCRGDDSVLPRGNFRDDAIRAGLVEFPRLSEESRQLR
jgi:hypothetical protein